MTLDFTDFGLGETIVFGVDVDPTTIQGVPGAGGAGAISGLELSGSPVTVTFSDGQVLTGQLFGDGSAGGGEVLVSSELGQIAPTGIEMLGVTTAPTVFPNNSQAGNVATAGPQTVRVTGPDGATVKLLAVDGQLQSPTPFDPDPFESDAATAVAYQTGVIAGGFVDFTVTIANVDDLYHFVAALDDGAEGLLTDILVIGVGDVDTPVIDPIANVAVTEGDTIAVPISATDPNGDPVTLDIVSTPDIEALGAVLTDNGDGTGSLDWVTETGDAGTYSVDITAFDGTNTGTTSFTIVVSDPNAEAIYRINSGGPQVAATDGGIPWSEDQSAAGSAFGGTAVAGTPSEYLISGGENAYGTADPIDLTDPSVPAGTPEALFQTEHWDPAAGAEMVYEFPVGSGQAYQVDLYFAEIFATADGVRQFAVDIEGVPVLNNYDIHAVAGHDAGVVASFVSPIIADDALTITFTHQVENPKVNAIEVSPTGPPPTDVPPTIDPIADKGVTVGGSLPVAITTTEPDGDVVTLGYSSVPDASSFTTFVDAGDGTGSLTFAPAAGNAGVYDITVTATDKDGTDTETFALTVSDPPVAGTVFARINAGGPQLPAVDGGPVWEADAFLTDPGSNGTASFPAVEPGPTVPSTVPGEIFDTERWSDSGFSYGVPVPAGTQVFVRLFLGNGYPQTNQPGQRVFDISIDGAIVADDFDIIPAFGDLTGGMLEYLITSDGTVDIGFANVIQNPLVNGIEVVSAASSPDQLGASPTAIDFGQTLVNGSQNRTVTLSNLGFEAGDPSITVTAVTATGGEFATDFVGPVVLGAGGSGTFDVTFSPTTTGPQTGSLSVEHSGSNSPVTITLDGVGSSNIPVSFDQSALGGESSNNPTSLQFGPDDRLYVAQQDGTVKAYTVVRNGSQDYSVSATETINLVKNNTPNHNDDGSTNSTSARQVTGLLVTGTAANPVLFVTSSDNRIQVGADSGLDTNSGVVSRLTWTGSAWDKVDLVRGLPRSEENHSTNGMALDEATNTLYVMQGGHANKGAPGNNFSGTPEYYLSAALLSVDLDAVDALGVSVDPRSGAQFGYDLQTLDDPTRANITNTDPAFPYAPGHPRYNSEIDVGDPFGGNNGINQAIPEPGGPVQIHSPGYRNAYDVVFTSQGRLYTSDNGPNSGWGGLPLVYTSVGVPKGTGPFDQAAGDYCTNEFNESGSNAHGDTLHFIDGASYYGGHPTPIRAFPSLSRVIVYEEQGDGNWVDVGNYDFYDLLPAGLTAADFPNDPVQCEYSLDDPAKILDIIGASTNGIAEYTASNFGGALQGDILTASFNGNIYDYKMNAAGDTPVATGNDAVLFGGFGSQPLDVTTQGDGDVFPGTIWSAVYGADTVVVFEPIDFGTCTGAYDINLDEDGDGFSNADEIDNGTNPCSGGSAPPDNDSDGLSDLNDPDDDNDGIVDVIDEFALDPDNGLTTDIPVLREFELVPGVDDGGFFNLGLTGLMTNGTTDYLDQFDPGTIDAGGATGNLGIDTITAGDAYQGVNTQDNGFQYGINADTTTAPFVVSTSLEPPFFDPLPAENFQSMGLQIGTGDQDNYLKVVINANNGNGGVQVLLEDGGATTAAQYGQAEIGGDVLSAGGGVSLYVVVDPAALTAQPQVQIGSGAIVDLGSPVAIPASWLASGDENGLAVGLISTSTNGPVFGATWGFLNVVFVGGNAPSISPVGDLSVDIDTTDTATATILDADGDPLTITVDIVPDASSFVTETVVENGPGDYTVSLDFAPLAADVGDYTVTITADDATNPVTEEIFTLSVVDPGAGPTVLYRVNAGGSTVAAADASLPDWGEDEPTISPYRVANGAGAGVYLASAASAHPGPIDMTDPSLPPSVPTAVFESERWDAAAAPEMLWQFPVDPGAEVEVRLFFAELFGTIDLAGERVIDVSVEGTIPAEFDDIDPIAIAGPKGAFMRSTTLIAADDTLDLEFIHVVENPAIKGIEIIEVTPAPPNTPPTVDPIADQTVAEGDPFSLGVVANDVDAGDTLSYGLSGDVPAGMTIDATGQIDFTPELDQSGSYDLTVEVDDGANPAVTEDFTLDVTQGTPLGSAIYRVNVGGPQLAAVDGSYPDWAVDTDVSPSPYLVSGGANIFNGTATDFTHPSIPSTVPPASFDSERWDAAGMTYSFPVDAGTDVEVRLQWAELFSGITAPGQRVIDVAIDGVPVGSVDPFAEAGFGGAYVTDYLITSDGSVDITLSPNVQNPALKGIEILGVAGEPSVSLLGALDGSTVTTSSLTVEWMLNGFTEPTDHVHFMIDGGDAAGTPGAHDTIMRPSTSIDLTGLADGSHTVSVQVADVGHVLYTNPAALDTATFTVSVPTTPPAPSGVAAVDGDAVVDLDWDDVAGATGYNVYRGTTTGVSSATGTLLTPTPATTSDFSDATAVNGTIYFYVVTAVNAFGESPDSAEVSGHPLPDLPVLERINAGGVLVTATDGPNQDWEVDTSAANHPTLSDAGTNGNSGGAVANRDPSMPSYVPQAVVTTERWSNNGTTDNPFTYDIPVPPGSTVDVRLFFGNSCACTQNPGQRAFDVTIEGVEELSDFDPSATFGHLTGGMVRFDSVVDDGDGALTIAFSKGLIENPMVNAIEVRQVSLDATAPLFTDPATFSFPIAENSIVVGDAVTDDAFAAITLSGGADAGLFDVVDNADGSATVSFLAAPDFENPLDVGGDNTYEIELTATDGAGNATVQPFTVDVFDIVVENLPPSLDPIGPQTVAEGTLLTVNPVATDSDDPTLAWSLQNEPAGMTIDGATGEITFTPDGDDSGTYTGITVVVNDGTNPDVTTDFDLTVTQTVIGTLRYAYNAGGPTSGIFVQDTNANPAPERSGGLQFGPSGGTVDVSGPTVPVGTPTDIFNTERYGTQTWTFPVSPGSDVEVLVYLAEVWSGATPGARVFDVSIDGVTLPEADDIDLAVDPGIEVATVIDRRYVDADGIIQVALSQTANNAKISAIEVREITAGPNVAPVITADPLTLSVEEETTGTADADATDANPFDSLTFSLDAPPTWASIDAGTGEMTFTPTTGDASPTPYTIKVDVTDGSLGDTIDVEVTVTPTGTNVDPVLDPVADQAVFPGELIDIAFNATDADVGDTLTLSLSSVPALPAGAVFDDGAGTGVGGLTWTPGPADTGIYAVTLTVNDGNGGIANQPFQILVGESLPLRINAGAGAPPTDWVPDVGYRTGGNTAAGADPIDLTDPSLVDTPAVEAMLQTESWGPQTWSALVPDGTYEVRLYFAETFNGLANQDARFFDVAIEGTQVLDDFKPWAEAGAPDKGVARSFVVEVTDGDGVGVELINEVGGDNAAIKGVEIRQVVLQANAGAAAVGTWDAADGLVTGGTAFGTGATIALDPTAPLTTPQAVLQNELYGNPLTWAIPVEDATSYEVRLYLVETFQTAPGSRTFGVTIEGLPWLTDYEMLDEVAQNELVVKRYFLTSTDTVLDIVMAATQDQATVKGVEIIAN